MTLIINVLQQNSPFVNIRVAHNKSIVRCGSARHLGLPRPPRGSACRPDLLSPCRGQQRAWETCSERTWGQHFAWTCLMIFHALEPANTAYGCHATIGSIACGSNVTTSSTISSFYLTVRSSQVSARAGGQHIAWTCHSCTKGQHTWETCSA